MFLLSVGQQLVWYGRFAVPTLWFGSRSRIASHLEASCTHRFLVPWLLPSMVCSP